MPLMEMFDRGIQLRMGQAHVRRWIDEIMPVVTDSTDPLGVRDLATHHLPLEDAARRVRDLPGQGRRLHQGRPAALANRAGVSAAAALLLVERNRIVRNREVRNRSIRLVRPARAAAGHPRHPAGARGRTRRPRPDRLRDQRHGQPGRRPRPYRLRARPGRRAPPDDPDQRARPPRTARPHHPRPPPRRPPGRPDRAHRDRPRGRRDDPAVRRPPRASSARRPAPRPDLRVLRQALPRRSHDRAPRRRPLRVLDGRGDGRRRAVRAPRARPPDLAGRAAVRACPRRSA